MKPGSRRKISKKVPELFIGGVIGHPIQHSLSPDIFRLIADQLKLPVSYQKFEVSPSELTTWTKWVSRYPILGGWNVTLPHKRSILPLLDHLTPEAKAVGAVNVVKNIQGDLYGYNTDVDGIRETLKECQFQIQGSTALVFGAGGSAQSVAYVLGHAQAKRVWVVNRTLARAREMAQNFGRQFRDTEFIPMNPKTYFQLNERVDLYVNATPLGMTGVSESFPFPIAQKGSALAFDFIYRPKMTPFLRLAKRQGLRTVGGLDMLIWQALAAWEIWVGTFPDRDRLRVRLKNQLKRHIESIL